ncbi:MAG: hypothetical protein ACE5D1_05415 [Fidelibacterota bacterium]
MNKTILLSLLGSLTWGQTSIIETKHNLSVSGTGPLTATGETQICIFCHASHNGTPEAPLWNRSVTNTTYTMYGSPSMNATSQQPGVTSRLCLGCHDGTVALGLVLNRTNPIVFPTRGSKLALWQAEWIKSLPTIGPIYLTTWRMTIR